MSISRRRPELRLSISQGRDGSQYLRCGTPEKSPSSGKYFLLTSPFIEQLQGQSWLHPEIFPQTEPWQRDAAQRALFDRVLPCPNPISRRGILGLRPLRRLIYGESLSDARLKDLGG